MYRAKNAFALSKVLSESIIRSYVETSLDSSLFQFEHHDSKTEPDLAALHALKPADMICQLWQRYTSTAMVPLASSVQAIRREMTTYNQHNVVRMEDKVNAVVQKSIDSKRRPWKGQDRLLNACRHHGVAEDIAAEAEEE